MQLRKRSVVAAALLTGATLTAATMTGVTGAGAATLGKVPTITAHMNSQSIWFRTGTTMHAGKIDFRVVTVKGDHELQIARLHSGYTLGQAFGDINKAFSGDVAAVRRVDDNITFLGGAEARPHNPGRVAVTLSAGHYVFLDQNSNALRMVTVTGKVHPRAGIPHASKISIFSYGFGPEPSTIPAKGRTWLWNQSDQPHFVEFQHVKANTTAAMVRKAFNPMNQSQPSFALKASTSAGVISPYKGQNFAYDLPPGKYVIACFWPDDDTGMPHAFMGMWKLITLK